MCLFGTLSDMNSEYSLVMSILYLNQYSLNSIYFQISIYTWQHTSIQIHGKLIVDVKT